MNYFTMFSIGLLLIISYLGSTVDSSGICGDPESRKDVRLATKEIVKRIMGMRKRDWTWDATTTPIVLQVSAPKLFFGRRRTARSFERNLKKNYNGMTMRQKAEYIIAAKALCLNERNITGIDLVKNMSEELSVQFPNNSRIPVLGYGHFSIGIGALCVNGFPIENSVIENFIAGQNENGSFGDSDHFSTTMRLLPPVHCLRLMKNPAFNISKINEVVRKMRSFLMENMPTDQDNPMTPFILISLWKTKEEGENPENWRCKELSKRLGIYPRPNEGLSDLTIRLMRIRGAAYLDVGSPQFECNKKTDPVPKGYVPRCNQKKPWTCKPKRMSKRQPMRKI